MYRFWKWLLTKLKQANENQTRLNQTKTKNIAKVMVSDKFWVNSDMLGIKEHVLKLENLMVTLKQWLEPNENQTKQNQIQRYSGNPGLGQILGKFLHVSYQ